MRRARCGKQWIPGRRAVAEAENENERDGGCEENVRGLPLDSAAQRRRSSSFRSFQCPRRGHV